MIFPGNYAWIKQSAFFFPSGLLFRFAKKTKKSYPFGFGNFAFLKKKLIGPKHYVKLFVCGGR